MIRLAVALLVGLGITSPGEAPTDGPPEPDRNVFQVEMIDISPSEFAFRPAEIRVRPGDIVHFVQTGAMPHNVEFREVPEGSALEDLTMGPFLIQRGQTYDLVIDDRFVPGTYPFVCTPHVTLGMKGTLIVESGPVAGDQEEQP